MRLQEAAQAGAAVGARVSSLAAPELDAAILQAAIMASLAALGLLLWRRTGKRHLAWWALAWALYAVRVGAIISFITTEDRRWLYWHQVITGCTALAILWATLVFTRQLAWRAWMALFLLFPLGWSYVAIYRLDDFLLAALPAVLFLSGATLAAAVAVLRYAAATGSAGARLLGWALAVWALHHLDYPFLRARGAWVPWGYYLDIVVALAVGAGLALLVMDDLRRGLDALSALSQELQRRGRTQDLLAGLLARPLTLPGVTGTALYGAAEHRFVQGAGEAADWTGAAPSGAAADALRHAVAAGMPFTTGDWQIGPGARRVPYAAVLPVFREAEVRGALVLVGSARDPFTALDDRFLVALGRQVGAALENADLWSRLEARTAELERLSARMLQQHEEERRRLSRELHDETAQVFSAVKMQLGALRPSLGEPQRQRLDRALQLVDTGIQSIRNVTNDLRPSLLDDLGLLPALRSLVTECRERSGLPVTLDAPAALPPISSEAELALFRALQEGLSNVLRHAQARAVHVRLTAANDAITLDVVDDGRGVPAAASLEQFEREGHMGLAGMRERLAPLGGSVSLARAATGGAHLAIRLPVVRRGA
jgi:signal transduction histidine kinase